MIKRLSEDERKKLAASFKKKTGIDVVVFFVLPLLVAVSWSREVRISGHGGHGSMQNDEIYILGLRSRV